MSIRIRDLKAGDVMLKHYDGSASNIAIRLGQALFSHNLTGGRAKITHAAVYLQGGLIAEASGSGVRRRSLHEDRYTWEVYRVVSQTFAAELAADFAYNFVLRRESPQAAEYQGFGRRYAGRKAVGALFGSSAVSMQDRSDIRSMVETMQIGSEFYCSQFVVLVYAMASEVAGRSGGSPAPLIDRSYMRVSPKALEAFLRRDGRWRHMGHLER